MSTDSAEDTRSVAIEQLEQFGLSAYAARTFVALTGLGIGTATDVSEVSDVPRTRVYDAVDELHERGLVDIQQSSPKKFWAASAGTTCQKFEQEMRQRRDLLMASLRELGSTQRKQERGVWTVNGQSAVTDRVLEFIERAEDEIVYMIVEELLTEDVTEALREAAHRGVSIRLAGVSPDVQETLRDEIPDAELFDTLWMWSDTPAGRLMMVDRTQTLVSVLVNDDDAALSDPRSETAIWGAGETNSLVAVLRAIFTWRLENDGLDD
ncbi:TrmB family transcriptional regulator [Haloferax chudinovii]|uniref:TrmB family transcriptional regulator n=1 Tax=Haloferax chudinovii TaxID=1109010 RepID=A0ABD5XJC6_9EURY